MFFAALEGAGRLIWGYRGDPDSLYVPHPYLIMTPRPGARLGRVTINSLGYRGKEFRAEKAPGVVRIACLGGSATFCDNVPDASTWPQRLEDELNARAEGGRRYEVINAGVPGYTTAESLINFSLRVLDLDPDIVIVYHSYNDFKPNRVPGFSSDYFHWRSGQGRVRRSVFRRRLASPQVLDWMKRRIGFPAPGGTSERFDTVSEPGLAAYRRNLESFAALARPRGIRVVFSSEATLIGEESFARLPAAKEAAMRFLPTLSARGLLDAVKRYDDEMRRAAGETNAVYVDNLHEVPKDFGHFIDHIHLTEAGCEAVADNFAEALREFEGRPGASPVRAFTGERTEASKDRHAH
jgi:lysophospholipase L1-like esterase